MPRFQGEQIKIRMNTRALDEFGQLLSLSNAELQKEFNKVARPAGRKVVDQVKAAAPYRRGLLKRKGIKLSVRRYGVFVRVAGFRGDRHTGLPFNIASLIQDVHRMPHGGRSRANPFIREVVARIHPAYMRQMERGVDNVLKSMQRRMSLRQQVKAQKVLARRSLGRL